MTECRWRRSAGGRGTLATGLALPDIVRGQFDGKAFAINVTSLGLSSTAVQAAARGIACLERGPFHGCGSPSAFGVNAADTSNQPRHPHPPPPSDRWIRIIPTSAAATSACTTVKNRKSDIRISLFRPWGHYCDGAQIGPGALACKPAGSILRIGVRRADDRQETFR